MRVGGIASELSESNLSTEGNDNITMGAGNTDRNASVSDESGEKTFITSSSTNSYCSACIPSFSIRTVSVCCSSCPVSVSHHFTFQSLYLAEVHELIGKDLDLASIGVQFDDLTQVSELRKYSLLELVKRLSSPGSEAFKDINIMLARILACTPHSADVERCISANNLLKTQQRSSVHIESENKYLYIHFNMPALEKWNPKQAVLKWLTDKKRRNPDILNSGKTIQQEYFKGVFEIAREEKAEENDDMGKFSF